MILSDMGILGRLKTKDGHYENELKYYDSQTIGIDPFDIDALQGASYDLKLAKGVILSTGVTLGYVFPLKEGYDDRFLIPPHQACLASTLEYIRIPLDCVGRVEGKSSIGRQHVIIHCTAGWIDPGFEGNITLEIVNHHPVNSFLFEPGMFIAQLTFLQLDRITDRPYKGKYQGDKGAQRAK